MLQAVIRNDDIDCRIRLEKCLAGQTPVGMYANPGARLFSEQGGFITHHAGIKFPLPNACA